MIDEGLLIVICGPSGAGKGTVYNNIINRIPRLKRSVSVTTRKPREGEIEGVHYYFKTIQEYQQMIADDEFLETASVFNNYYGTPKQSVMDILETGDNVLFEIDVEGAKQIKAKYSSSVLIFLMTPNFDELKARLIARGTENEESLKIRLSAARNELEQYPLFDYIVINDDIDLATDKVEAIIAAERARVRRNNELINDILKEND